MSTHLLGQLPVNLERDLRIAGGYAEHPDAIVHYALTAARLQQRLDSGESHVEPLLQFELDRLKAVFNRSCECSVEVRPTDEYHECQCYAGDVLRRFDRFMANLTGNTGPAKANITIG